MEDLIGLVLCVDEPLGAVFAKGGLYWSVFADLSLIVEILTGPTTCLDSIDNTQNAAIKGMWSLLWVLNILNWITLHGV